MNSFNPDAKFSNMWKAFYNMPTNTTVSGRIVEKVKSEQASKIKSDIAQATSREYIQSKKVEGKFLKRLEAEKRKQADNTLSNIQEIRRFIGKGMKIDQLV